MFHKFAVRWKHLKLYRRLLRDFNSGYIHDFNLHSEWIKCLPLDKKLKHDEFHVDEVHRFEGMSSTDDNSVLYAVSSAVEVGLKGLLVDAYGVYAASASPEMLKKLRIDGYTNP